MYKPNPIDTTNVILPAELIELTEKIAENVHENWSAGRIADGWTYGEKRDDVKKPHLVLCLIRNFPKVKNSLTEIQQWKH